ncbi:MAG: helix-turn-helix domain-containing protein [Rhodospirillales bacterium]
MNNDEAVADLPLTSEEFARAMTARLARKARKAARLTQEAFSRTYGIPVATLRDWEQGRRAPDAAAASYLRAITNNPKLIAQSLYPAST